MQYVTYQNGKTYHFYDEDEQSSGYYKRTKCGFLTMKIDEQSRNPNLCLPVHSFHVPKGYELCKVCDEKQREEK